MEKSTSEKFTFFWKKDSPFSQWHDNHSVFYLEGIKFYCTEQYMMYCKAMLFGDYKTAEKMKQKEHPNNYKKWGREVKNFDKELWEKNCKQIVYRGNFAKFTQNARLLNELFNTKGTTLVEASPYDTIWGIGLKEDDQRAHSRDTWLGTNWLGEILTELREDLIKQGYGVSILNKKSQC